MTKVLVAAVRALAVLVLLAAVPAPALAADPTTPGSNLGLSLHEEGPWTTSLGSPLFDPDARWVPGDSVTAGFWAMNRSSDSTEFRITLLPQVQSLLSSKDFEVRVRAGEGDTWQPVRSAWTAPRPLAAGERMNIQIRATLHDTAANATQRLAFAFDLRTRLTYQGPVVPPSPRPTPTPTAAPADPGAGDGDGASDPQDPATDDAAAIAIEDTDVAGTRDGWLPGTGVDQPAWLVPLGAGALITGLWMALVARRRPEEGKTSDE